MMTAAGLVGTSLLGFDASRSVPWRRGALSRCFVSRRRLADCARASATGNPFYGSAGFSAVIPGGTLAAGPATLTVAAHTPGKGTWTQQVQVNVGSGGTSAASTGTTAEDQTGLVLIVQQPEPAGQV